MKINRNELHASLRESLARHAVPGASVAVFHEERLTSAAAGVINVNTGVEVTPDTVMHIGSIAKVFTATLIMQLVDEGQVDLNAKVARYLPDLQLADGQALEQITVKMLLNHTSGIDGSMLPDQGHDEETIEKGIARFAQLGQIHSPGSEYSYCNAGAVIAGYLAQRVAKRSWYRLVRERILEPLQMEHSATLPEEALLHRAGVGHYLAPAPHRKQVPVSQMFLPLSFSPGGTSLMTSARDLVEFARTHMGNGVGAVGTRILSERSAREMQQMTVNNAGKGYAYTTGIGLGWMVSADRLLHHSGGGPGIVAVLYVYPEKGFAVAMQTNAQFECSFELIGEILDPWLTELGSTKSYGMPGVPSPRVADTIDSDAYAGIFENNTTRYSVSQGPNGLALSAQAKWSLYDYTSTDATAPMPLTPLGQHRFLLEADEVRNGHSWDALRIFAFRNPDATGRMRHVGNADRLYVRVS